MVNQTKITLINTFIDNHVALESEKQSKNGKMTLLQDCARHWDSFNIPDNRFKKIRVNCYYFSLAM